MMNMALVEMSIEVFFFSFETQSELANLPNFLSNSVKIKHP